MRNQKGFSLSEMLVGLVIVALVGLAVGGLEAFVSKTQKSLNNKLEQSTDQAIAERVIYKDLAQADVSYNNIKAMDDTGKGFFEYYPDVPVSFLKGNAGRVITVTPRSQTKAVYFLSQDLDAGSPIMYDPVAAYKIGEAPADFNKAATVTFMGLNNNQFISSATYANRPLFWKDGMALMLDSPARLRPTQADGSLNMQVAPRSPVFIGVVQGSALNSLAAQSEFGSLLNYTQPDTGEIISSVDNFLRRAPSVGGGQPIIRLRAVKVLKYFLQERKAAFADCISADGGKYVSASLYRAIFENNGFSHSALLDDKVCGIQFIRNSVGEKIIYFNVMKPEVK